MAFAVKYEASRESGGRQAEENLGVAHSHDVEGEGFVHVQHRDTILDLSARQFVWLQAIEPPMALQFVPFSSEIELPFYSVLSTIKIDHDRLDETSRSVLGLYEPRNIAPTGETCRMQILGNALTSESVPAGFVRAEGKIKNVNTLEAFKDLDKTAIIQAAGKQIWDAIKDGTIYSIPSLLASFTIISYADLKRHKFHYWFAFPALHSDPTWERIAPIGRFNGEESTCLVEKVNAWRYYADPREQGFFLAKKVKKDLDDPSEYADSDDDHRPTTPGETEAGASLDYNWVIGSLRDYEQKKFFKDVPPEDQYVCFVDPSTYKEAPAWCLRNLLVLVRERYKLDAVNILCYRDIQARRHEARSFVLHLAKKEDSGLGTGESSRMPKVTGWERNSNGKLNARMTSLAQYMNPEQLADQSVDLNLKLMKWRLAPDLDLDVVKQTKCLLLGAGTLGSYVSRNLLGWGVRKITFVDYGNVSYSNPVRQPLFNFKDCLEGGAKKAYRAAEALKEIYPGVESVGHVLSVPMLGHPILDEKRIKEDYKLLEALIKDHDVIFLLLDTREARWLPTLMGKAMGKTVLNAALGFDTYVVMRHGLSAADGGPANLGCYFCNDVVAPIDSMKDATLDQQCTVTRPGIAAIASASIVELLVSLLQHPLGAAAPAPKVTNPGTPSATYDRDPENHPLGIVPHQIRGFLSTFQNMVISGQSYDCCSACSQKVCDAYREGGWDFVKKALTEKGYITELSGLAEVQRRAEEVAEGLDWDESDNDLDAEDGEML